MTPEIGCRLCRKELKGAIKSKVWIHIGVTHDKTNEILQKKGIDPIRVNIRMNKRKASEDTSPTMMIDEEKSMMASGVPRLLEYPSYSQPMGLCPPGQVRTNTCKLCGQVIIVSHWSILLKSLFSFVRRPRTGRCDNCSQERDVVSLSQLTKKYMFLFAMGDSIVTLEEEEGDCENNPVPSR